MLLRFAVVGCFGFWQDAWREHEGIARIDVLKIDVEGHDVPVLRGARRTLAARLPIDRPNTRMCTRVPVRAACHSG